MSAPVALTFLGAARTVTGSKYLVEAGPSRILVDCGLFQGLKELRERNWQPLPFEPAALDAVVLTHAHVDHCGYLPRLVAAGFGGRVFCTPGTAQLCRIVLPDAGRLQEEDAAEANRQGYTRHRPALPLFTEADAIRALGHLQPVGYDRSVPVAPGVEATFINAGHLLGSAFVRLTVADGAPRTILFGGDLGRYDRPVLPDPSRVDAADVLLVESTYGDRRHEPDDGGVRLAEIVNATVERGGKVVIPAFAIGRVEEVLYWLRRLEETGRIPELPVYLDSPMAATAREQYAARLGELDPEIQAMAKSGRTGARAQAERAVCAFSTARFQVVSSLEESRRLAASRTPAVVVSSSGMATGGRVLHHLRAVLPDPRHTVLFVGYQAAGTRGRRLIDGETQVKIHGEFVPVCARIEAIDAMSAHADAEEILRWLSGFERPPVMTHLVHGEPPAMQALAERIARALGWATHMPRHLERVDLSSARIGAGEPPPGPLA